ncbi:unnamed protein product [Kuraishia capsulata CBS 1993]|uniref:D-lactate dehydrogenase (cytochrome) n=1 Tax=Kuraishia capsulata CBS 1993 TaxID=1382522 RepID=W6MG20_9ASCO|nr:uncharacterized protein KUCA_T00000340001 [Kuraishia capsulata CBS 1993]CDK24378.1 unnamed protein product [Kuraishia capsulata CBS 1993]
MLMRSSRRLATRLPLVKSVQKSLTLSQTRTLASAAPQPESDKSESSGKSSTPFSITPAGIAVSLALFGVGGYLGYSRAYASPPTFLYPETSTTPLEDLEPPKYASDAEFDRAIEEIAGLLGAEHVSRDQPDLQSHADSEYNCHHAKPDEVPRVIVFPGTTEEVSTVMKVCHKYRVPVIPYSGGTSLEGQYISTRKGLTLDFSRMDAILEFNKGDLDITLQPGVGWQDLDEFLKPHGLLFGPDPGPGAQIGGMVATSCSGTNAFRYGTMKENVLSLEVVLADGSIIKTRRRPRKTAAGYNLTSLFIGSEGSLGIVTKATLKLNPRPAAESIAVIAFDKVEEATGAVQDFIRSGVSLNAVELLNAKTVYCVNESKQLSQKLDEKPTLFIKVGGPSQVFVDETVKIVKRISKDHNVQNFRFATSETEKTELWAARKIFYWSTLKFGRETVSPDVNVWTTDVAVPISQLATLVKECEEDIEKSGILGTIIGHVGDGNFHTLLVYTPEQAQIAMDLVQRQVYRGLEVGGTCTGEHAVGYGKRTFLEKELGDTTISTMRKVKMGLDPLRLLNPDKIFKIDPNDKEH